MRVGRPAKRLTVEGVGERTAEVLRLSADLVRIPSVTNCADERVDQVQDNESIGIGVRVIADGILCPFE